MANNNKNIFNPVQDSGLNAKNKKKKYSLTVITSTALIIIAVIILNVIMAVLADRVSLNVDLTKDSILSFSDTTKKIVSELDTNVKIISLIPASDDTREVIQIDEILKKYDIMSDKISYSRVDTKKNPAMLTRYELDGQALSNDYHIIFESDKNYTVVNVQDFLTKYYHNNKNMILTGALGAEQYFTSAINKVCIGGDVNIYVLAGHNEKFNAEDFQKRIMPGSGINFKDITLISEDIPDDADMIISASPETDYTEGEIIKIDAYMRDGGDMKVIVDYNSGNLNNLYSYLREWGVAFEDGIAADNNTSSYAEAKINIIANVPQNEITNSMGIGSNSLMFLLARPIKVKETVNTTCDIIATTSDDGYIKKDIRSGVDSFETGDVRAKSNLAVVLKRQNSVDSVSNMAVFSTSYFFGSYNNKDFSILDKTGNRALITGIVNYMTDQPTVIIAPKNIYQGEIVVSQKSIYVYTVLTALLIPLAILSLGLIIWLRRRHS